MKTSFSIICRGSWLSLARAGLFAQKVKTLYPGVELNTVIRQTEGDKNQSTPLHLMQGKDCFTRDIQDFLKTGGGDFAVHAMKHISGEDFLSNSEYALLDRDDIRDVVVFNESVMEKLQQGAVLRIGTSSPRRSIMAVEFLQKALPWLGAAPRVQVEAVRGNTDKRLRKLHEGKYDGLILDVAGLSRLLRYAPAETEMTNLLRYKKLMLLPLFECPPVAGQGAIIAEAAKDNADAVQVLKAINNAGARKAIHEEQRLAHKYGHDYLNEFGVFHMQAGNTAFTFASGQDAHGRRFNDWHFTVDQLTARQPVFSTIDNMSSFFSYKLLSNITIDATVKALFIASHRAVHDAALVAQCKKKRVWAAGTKTWLHLAQKGIWVEGCADGLGIEVLEPVWQGPLFNLPAAQLQVLTNKNSLPHWQQDGWQAQATYQLLPALDKSIQEEVAAAGAIFWASYQQYELCRPFLRNNVVHACPSGKTAALLQAAGLQPVVFPTNKAFQQWKY